jgi:hypothetical protein
MNPAAIVPTIASKAAREEFEGSRMMRLQRSVVRCS